MASTTAATLICSPTIVRAPVGHASTQAPHTRQRPSSVRQMSHGPAPSPVSWSCSPPGAMIACSGHAATQLPQRMQRSGSGIGSGAGDWLSGLWHHAQRSGQPLRNTVVRMPGPS